MTFVKGSRRGGDAYFFTAAAVPAGLTSAEAAERLKRHGPNTLPQAKPRPALARFAMQFHSALIYFLLAGALERKVPRERIVEVGNLASAARGFGGRFLPALRRYLLDLDYRWVVFTATREVRGILQHLAFETRALAPASPERLPDRGAGWGTYYAHDPSVMAGTIE